MMRVTWARLWPMGLALAVLLVAIVPSAQAGGQEDYDLGKGLLERKWFDMAETVFRNLSQSGQTQELKDKGELGLIDVLKKRAEDTDDPELKEKGFDEAIAKYKEFLKGKSDPQALFNLAELLKTKGTEFTTQIKLTDDEKEKKDFEKKSSEAFKEAAELIDNFLKKIKKVRDTKGYENMSIEQQTQLRNAMFYIGDLHYLMAKVFEGAKDKKIEILRKADLLFEEFIWDFEDYGQAYLAYVKRGLICVEMEEYGAALDHYNTVLLVPEPEGATPSQKAMRDRLRIMGYYRYLEALVKAGKFDDALAKAREMETEYPKCIEDSFPDPYSGRAAVLEKAKALAGKGEFSDAIQEAVKVVDKGGYYMQVGMKLLGDWAAQDPTVGPRINLLQAQGLYQQRKFVRAIQAYQDALDKLSTEEEMKSFGTEAWTGLAVVYASRRMYYEAGLAYQEGERIAQVFLRGLKKPEALWEQAAECAYQAYRNFKWAHGETKNKSQFLADLYQKQRSMLTTRYSESTYAKNLQFFAAQDKLKAGEYLDAVNSFKAVDEKSEFFETSIVGIGQAYFKEYDEKKKEEVKRALEANEDLKEDDVKLSDRTLGYLKDAEDNFKKYLSISESKPVEGDEAEARRKILDSLALFFLGRVYNERGDWDTVLSTLDGFEEKFKNRQSLVLTATFLRLRAFYKQGEARKVEDMLRLMEDFDEQLRSQEGRKKKHMYVIIGYQLSGAIYSEKAAKAKTNSEPEAYREFNDKAAEYLWEWIKADILVDIENADPNQVIGRLDAVGIRLFNAKDFEKAARVYDVILVKFGEQIPQDSQVRFKRALGNCYVELKEWEKALGIFQELYTFKKTPLFIEKLVLCHSKLGDKFSSAAQAKKANQHYDEALKLYNIVLKQDQPEKKQWWVWKLAVWTILFKKGEYKEVVQQITNASLLYPTMGSPGLKKQITELQEKAKQRSKR